MSATTGRLLSSARTTATVALMLAAGSVMMGAMTLVAIAVRLEGSAGTLVDLTVGLAVAALAAFTAAGCVAAAAPRSDTGQGAPTLQPDR